MLELVYLIPQTMARSKERGLGTKVVVWEAFSWLSVLPIPGRPFGRDSGHWCPRRHNLRPWPRVWVKVPWSEASGMLGRLVTPKALQPKGPLMYRKLSFLPWLAP